MRELLRAFFLIKDPSQIMPACLLTAGLLLLTLCATTLKHSLWWHSACAGIRLRLAMSGLIFDKMLTLNQKAMGTACLGNIITLISVDAQKLEGVSCVSPIILFSYIPAVNVNSSPGFQWREPMEHESNLVFPSFSATFRQSLGRL
ncbi:unnamed protein product [Dibothriocephalus latus]|uniref:ABC transmembrane type-1 domain-containing protein n=1 Tax=Dibothriocephalus latus TaxID=60516 RepID=A0A3P7P351_DIBLA|nr:unnamed protein product [Dibothriocephalus latus]